MTTLPCIGVVGTGPVARAVAFTHVRAGGDVVAVLSRDPDRAAALASECGAVGPTSDPAALGGCDVVVVCVADRAVAEVGARLSGAVGPDVPVLHTSGALPGATLIERVPAGGFRAGSLHPLQSFTTGASGPAGLRALAASMVGTHWFHEGDGIDQARALVAAWGGVFHALAPGGKALYHAGAAVVSNHSVALFADATRLLAAAGVPPSESRAALATLLDGTASNLRRVGVPAALTGPVARGDVATVRRHVAALRARAPDLLECYCAMARRAVVVAREKGTIDSAAERSLLEVLA